MNEPYPSGARCAYELCQKTEPIEIIPGHRRKFYHDENCRQAQHRLLAARRVYEGLRQLWTIFLPETQKFLEDLLAQHGETWARQAIAMISAERDQAQQVPLTEDEQAALQQQWAKLQPFTRNILESLLTEPHDPLSLLNLITLAIGEEQRHASCNSELEQRNAYLEITLAEYRRIIDLEDREKIRQQWMAVGQLLGYRALPKHRVGEGAQKWEDYASWTHEATLADIVLAGREILAEEEAVRTRAQERSQVKRVERQLAEAHQRIEKLEQQLAEAERLLREERAEPLPALVPRLMPLQAYLHRMGNALPLRRGKTTLLIKMVRDDAVAYVEGKGHITLSDEEIEQMRSFVAEKTGSTYGVSQDQALRERLETLETEKSAWIAWKEAEVLGGGDMAAMRQFLQEHEEETIPVRRNGVVVRVLALGQDGVAVTADHGMIRLSDEELEQGRVWVCRKTGAPIIATRAPIGESHVQGQHRLQLERELALAQAQIQALQDDPEQMARGCRGEASHEDA